MSIDKSVSAKNQHQPGGANWQVGGILNIDAANGGSFQVNNVDITAQLEAITADEVANAVIRRPPASRSPAAGTS